MNHLQSIQSLALFLTGLGLGTGEVVGQQFNTMAVIISQPDPPAELLEEADKVAKVQLLGILHKSPKFNNVLFVVEGVAIAPKEIEKIFPSSWSHTIGLLLHDAPNTSDNLFPVRALHSGEQHVDEWLAACGEIYQYAADSVQQDNVHVSTTTDLFVKHFPVVQQNLLGVKLLARCSSHPTVLCQHSSGLLGKRVLRQTLENR